MEFNAGVLMEFLEKYSTDPKFYTTTHKIKDELISYEIYYEDKKWRTRQYKGFDLRTDNWIEFSKEDVSDFFKDEDLCESHFIAGMMQSIVLQLIYHDSIVKNIEDILSKNVADSYRAEYKRMVEKLAEKITKSNKPSLVVIDGEKEDK